MNAPSLLTPGCTVEAVQHIAQDLRAEAHRVPEDIARTMRAAASVCDAYAALRSVVGELLDAEPCASPFSPPAEEEPSCN